MASDGSPGTIPAASVVSSSQPASGKTLPQSGNAALTLPQSGNAAAAAKTTAASSSDPQTLVDQLNKYLNDSGRPDQFRVDPDSDSYIQQVNPANGAVIAQFAVSEFPALARSIGVSGLLVDEVA